MCAYVLGEVILDAETFLTVDTIEGFLTYSNVIYESLQQQTIHDVDNVNRKIDKDKDER